MEPTLLFVVEDAFQITDRGCILVPGPVVEPGGPTLHVGDPIRLVKPDGQVVDTTVRAFEMIGRRPPPKIISAPILLPREITKDQVPIGTQVLSLRDQCSANQPLHPTAFGGG
ncbi:MAG: hypothetical protein QE485_01805 [Acidovorax sp.]|uniref:hypothetical protein n=1 Tax=Acidovorax sp. TaxID=1872122 RepID=UPI002626D2D7|nr:hypothetical protein [Acidovorax sp.]MDH4415941.1 hypothetical protein [Acidovorax sp.]